MLSVMLTALSSFLVYISLSFTIATTLKSTIETFSIIFCAACSVYQELKEALKKI